MVLKLLGDAAGRTARCSTSAAVRASSRSTTSSATPRSTSGASSTAPRACAGPSELAAARGASAARFVERDLLEPVALAEGQPAATHAVCSEVLEHVDDPVALMRNVR